MKQDPGGAGLGSSVKVIGYTYGTTLSTNFTMIQGQSG